MADNAPSTAATSLEGTPAGAVTPALSDLPPDQAALSLRVSLADLCARAAVLYAQHKKYEEAAELYARAAEMQAELNGEMHPDNAEILFLYGRALFKVGQAKSDVLGGKAAADGGDGETAKQPAADATAAAAAAAAPTKEEKEAAAAALQDKKPLFQFAGDEEWDQSDEEEAEADDGDNDEEDEDDLAVAFEVLDLARVLFEKQLEEKKKSESETAAAAEENGARNGAKGKEKAAEDGETTENADGGSPGSSPAVVGGALRHVLERLADTHDLLAEISLENERYPNAIVDSRASLAYKTQFLPEESESIAEAHFKLSLALEFASVTTASGDDDGDGGDKPQQPQQVDQDLRDEAARELEAAITSTRRKLQNKEVELATTHAPEENDATRRQIADVKEIIADMELRLVDLRKPPIDLNAAVNGPAGAGLGSLLGALGGGGGGGGPSSVEAAKKAATDLTGLVRKKAKDGGPSAPAETNGKRKATAEADEADGAKKARTAESA